MREVFEALLKVVNQPAILVVLEGEPPEGFQRCVMARCGHPGVAASSSGPSPTGRIEPPTEATAAEFRWAGSTCTRTLQSAQRDGHSTEDAVSKRAPRCLCAVRGQAGYFTCDAVRVAGPDRIIF